MSTPNEVRVRMYNVGFGDCFLLSFTYPGPVSDALDPATARSARHVLIDFGSTSGPRNGQKMATVAKQVALDCGGQLDAIVVTHRHRDHLSGFGSAATAKIIAALNPRLIVRSWTEDPELARDAGRPGASKPANLGAIDAAYLATLAEGQGLAEGIRRRAEAAGRGRRKDLVQMAEDEVANADAVAELDRLAALSQGEYLASTGGHPARRGKTRLADVLPGVGVQVLGPPRPKDWPAVARQAAESREYWLGIGTKVDRLFSEQSNKRTVGLGTSRWIVDQLRRDEERQLATLVRWLDDALNNTSIVLLIKAGDHRMLFGGDAQIENWSWALDQAVGNGALGTALADLDFYKVGHHGSRNATPKSLVGMWRDRPPGSPLLSMMSTKHGVHGHGEHVVPRPPLVQALATLGEVLSTDGDVAWIDARAAIPTGGWSVSRG